MESTEFLSGNARADAGGPTVQANALSAGLLFNSTPPSTHTHLHGAVEIGLKVTLTLLLEIQ